MKVSLRRHNEKGFATYLVIIIIVIMGILLAGLLPFSTTVTQSAAYTKNALQAQYIAEAGAKRAIAALSSGSTVPWLDKEVKKVDGSTDTTSYIVRITSSPAGWSKNSAPVKGTYTIVSTGNYGKFSKKVTVDVDLRSSPFPTSDLLIGGSLTSGNTSTIKQLNSNARINVNGSIDAHIIQSTEISKYIDNKKFRIPEIDFKKAMAGAINLPFPDSDHQSKELTGDRVYKYDNNGEPLNYDNNYNNWGYTTSGSGYAVVVVNGDLNWSGDNNNINGNIIFLVNGDVNINSSSTNFASSFFYCNNLNINQEQTRNFGVKAMIRKDLKLNSSIANLTYISAYTDIGTYLSQYFTSSGSTVSNSVKILKWGAY